MIHTKIDVIFQPIRKGNVKLNHLSIHVHKHTVDCFIFVGPNFCGLNENDTFVGLKIRGHSVSFIIHTENYQIVGSGIRGSDPP